MSGHSPGPWTFEDQYVFDPSGEAICRIEISKDIIGTAEQHLKLKEHWAEQQANRRLIAAAPELLAHLRFALKLMGPLIGHTAQAEAMRAVIEKATQP